MFPPSENPIAKPQTSPKSTFQFTDFEGNKQTFEVEQVKASGELFDGETSLLANNSVNLDLEPYNVDPRYYFLIVTATNVRTGDEQTVSEILNKEQRIIFHDTYKSDDLRIEILNFEYKDMTSFSVDFGTQKNDYALTKEFLSKLFTQRSFVFEIEVGKAMSMYDDIPPSKVNECILAGQTLDLIGAIVIFPYNNLRSTNQLRMSFKEQIMCVSPLPESKDYFIIYDLARTTEYVKFEKVRRRNFKVDFDRKLLIWDDYLSQTLVSVAFRFIDVSWIQFLQFCIEIPDHFRFDEGIWEIAPLPEELILNQALPADEEWENKQEDTDSENASGAKNPLTFFSFTPKQQVQTHSEAWEEINQISDGMAVRSHGYSHTEITNQSKYQMNKTESIRRLKTSIKNETQSSYSIVNNQTVTNRTLILNNDSETNMQNDYFNADSEVRPAPEFKYNPNEDGQSMINENPYQISDIPINDMTATFTQQTTPALQNESQLDNSKPVLLKSFNPFADDFGDESDEQQEIQRGLHDPADKFIFAESGKCYVFKEAKITVYSLPKGETDYLFYKFIRLSIDTDKYQIDHNWRFKHALVFEFDDTLVFTIDSKTINSYLFKCSLSTGALIKTVKFESEILSIDINGKPSLLQRNGLVVLTEEALNYVKYNEFQVTLRRAIDKDFGFKSVKVTVNQRCILGSSQGQIIFFNSPSDMESNYMLLTDESEVQVLDINNCEGSALLLQNNSISAVLNLQGMGAFSNKSEDGLSSENIIPLSFGEQSSEASKTGAIFEPSQPPKFQRVLIWKDTLIKVYQPLEELSGNEPECTRTIEAIDPIFSANWDQNERDAIIIATAFGVFKVNLQ